MSYRLFVYLRTI